MKIIFFLFTSLLFLTKLNATNGCNKIGFVKPISNTIFLNITNTNTLKIILHPPTKQPNNIVMHNANFVVLFKGLQTQKDTAKYTLNNLFTTTSTSIIPIYSATGKIWMDRNLGATRRAQSANDHLAYGSLFQWGRNADGHELINWTSATSGTSVNGTTTNLSKATNPKSDLFILSTDDWRTSQNKKLWQGSKGINNPCPTGYRVPTSAELAAEIIANNITNSFTAFESPLSLTSSGRRINSEGTFHQTGSHGHYWSSTINGTNATYLDFSIEEDTIISNTNRANGFSVRCIKD